jgi:hypothetical protein|tara:strand:- start:1988 stop:2350 length:363 start_codon:yes stop_codon:yes gene_type:complete
MKHIKQENKKDLTLKCVDLVSKTFVELGQTKSEQDIVILAQSLCDDLYADFKNLMFEDIQMAFRKGVRNTDLFVLNVKTYYSWIKSWRAVIWEARCKVENEGADPKTVVGYRPEPKLLTK